MQVGMVGLGRMGAGMTRRLLRGDHQVVVYDLSAEAMASLAAEGAQTAASLADVVAALPAPRVVWMMVPAGAPTEQAATQLGRLLDPGDVLVDGGNTPYTESMTRAALLAESGINFVDAGTSGGVWGLEEGYCLMVGADREVFARLEPVLATLATKDGYARVGPVGAGHYTKMVHNGVEYAMMQAYAEGFELLRYGAFELDVDRVAQVWQHGSVVRSWLLDLAVRALTDDPDLERLAGYVDDSGEGRWALGAAIDYAVPAPTIAAALFARFASRREDAFGNRMLAALRNQFGGHGVRRAHPEEQA